MYIVYVMISAIIIHKKECVRMKKYVALMLIVANLFMLSCVPVSAAGNGLGAGEVTAEQIEKTMERITEAVNKIDELKDAADSAGSIASTFSEFMKVAGYVGTALSIVNGSVTFLKLIGIMDDPVTDDGRAVLCFALTALIALAALTLCGEAHGKNNRKRT